MADETVTASSLYTPLFATHVAEEAVVYPEYMEHFDVTVNGLLPVGVAVVEGGELLGLFCRVSPEHARSVEFLWYRMNESGPEEIPHIFLEIGDQYYSVITAKGLDQDNLRSRLSHVNHPVHVEGVDTGVTMDRVQAASLYLTNAGVDTDWVMEVRQIHEFLVPDGEGGIRRVDYNGLIDHIVSLLPPLEAFKGDDGILEFLRANIVLFGPDVRRILEGTRIFSLYRAQAVAERLIDLDHARSPDDYRKVFRRVFGYVNEKEAKRAQKLGVARAQREWNYESDEDIYQYLVSELPTLLGRNLARMHKAGIYHTGLSRHNISLVGSIVDLDCAIGEPLGLGDAAITEDQIRANLLGSLGSMTRTLANFLPHLASIERYQADISLSAWNYFRAYHNEMGGNLPEDIIEASPYIQDALPRTDYLKHRHPFHFSYYMQDYIGQLIIARLSLQHPMMPLWEEIADQVLAYVRKNLQFIKMVNGLPITNQAISVEEFVLNLAGKTTQEMLSSSPLFFSVAKEFQPYIQQLLREYLANEYYVIVFNDGSDAITEVIYETLGIPLEKDEDD